MLAKFVHSFLCHLDIMSEAGLLMIWCIDYISRYQPGTGDGAILSLNSLWLIDTMALMSPLIKHYHLICTKPLSRSKMTYNHLELKMTDETEKHTNISMVFFLFFYTWNCFHCYVIYIDRQQLCWTRSISRFLMPWLLASPGHQHPWYWLCRIGKCLSYLRKDFNYPCHVNMEE